MPGIEIHPFAAEHVDAASALLSARHESHRRAEPLLPAELDFRGEIEALLAADTSGTVAVQDGEVIGYLLGTHRENPVWGANVWVELAGHAVREPEVVRDLYAAAAEGWVEQGRTRHYVIVPASEHELADAWFRLSFGQQHAFGIREVADERPVQVAGVTVREANEDDVDALVGLAPLLNEHQSLTPVFSGAKRPDDGELRADIVEDLASARVANLVAEVDGRIVANWVVCPVELSDTHVGPARPPGAAFLAFAITRPEARGSGAGLALTAASFVWAAERAYATMVTDWRVTNLLSSRFWPKRGFRPTFLRLYRSIP